MRALALFAMLCLVTPTSAAADVIIRNDVGGKIKNYLDFYGDVRAARERVIIDGVCLSACTLALGIIPKERICVTRRARLGFHAAWLPGPDGPIPSADGTAVLMNTYAVPVRQWIKSRGGLQGKMMYLQGAELYALYPTCTPPAGARVVESIGGYPPFVQQEIRAAR